MRGRRVKWREGARDGLTPESVPECVDMSECARASHGTGAAPERQREWVSDTGLYLGQLIYFLILKGSRVIFAENRTALGLRDSGERFTCSAC